ncbi:MAG: GtrA family protein [Magnetococcales bacterium]|nr:GtrA family protein [Magnetococcales bacterium]
MVDPQAFLQIRKSVTQLAHYFVVGILSNSVGYLMYLSATYLGATPKITMTLLYGVGAAIGFVGNRNLTFSYKGSLIRSGIRYIIVHCVGYVINLVILIVLVDRLGYPHQWIQAMAIFVVAGFLFLAFKFFVFTSVNISNTEKR